MKDQWDCVLNDLEELGDEDFVVLMDQCNIDLFSCCLRLLPSYLTLPHFIRPILWILKFGPRIQSLHLLLEVIVHAEEECSVFLPLGKLDRIGLLVHFSLASARKRKYTRLRFRGFLLVVVLPTDRVCDRLVQAMTISDPRVRIIFVYRFKSNFSLHVCLATSWLWLLTRAQFRCSLESNLSCQLICCLVVTYTHDTSLALQITKLVSMFCQYCPTSTVVKHPASVQKFIARIRCGSLSTRSLYFCWREKWIILLCHDKSPYYCSTPSVLFTQVWDCSVDTELVNRNGFAKVWLVSPSALKWKYFPSFPSEHASGERTRCSENWVSAFSEIDHHQFSDSIPLSSWSFVVSGRPLCLWPRCEEWPTSCWKSLCK